ncbi:sugar ABC transporter ATP-binding protein [Nocardioides sp. NBC_00850]|uniref:sugar ABC transporter ATP-binding protein n=1 Tax=Nocardioides sp. NBC_00850 TaxID=2976001 RepID=UPI0038634DFE|nr:sugar ABC transporter ATP-binding protein [Nocardioides sp. NBC_00850]
MTDHTDFAISVAGVTKSFGPTRALDGVNLQVRTGESHALLGRNGAGKSTLISVLTGLVTPDSGSVEIRGSASGETDLPGSSNVACVYQQSTLVTGLTVAENISLGAYPTKPFGRVDWPEMRRIAADQLREWGYEHIVDERVEDLEPLEKKVVEVCRALARGARILLLDEPTAGLDDGACNELFAQINRARERGVTVIYVSHHLDEIFKVCDAITILRDGRDVLEARVDDFTVEGIVDVLAGGDGQTVASKLADLGEQEIERRVGDPVLEATEIDIGAVVRKVSLTVRAGESVGLTGLEGAGHIQLAQAIVGQIGRDGVVTVDGVRVPPGSIRVGIRAGLGYVPEDRHHNGFAPDMSIEENATLTVLDDLRSWSRLISKRQRRERFDVLSAAWSIKAASRQQAISELSGGNQQKVVLARGLAADPKVLVLIHPTAGVDVTAKESIYTSIRSLQKQGCAVLIVSSDDDDLAICDRTAVMYRGRLHAELARGWDERDLVAAIQGSEAQPA